MTIRSGSNTSSVEQNGYIYFSNGTSGDNEYKGTIVYEHANDALKFGTNGGAERLRITSGGQVAIGTVTAETNFLTTINGDLSLGEKNGTDNTYIDQKQNGDLHIINSGRDSSGAAVNLTGGAGGIGINRYNTIAGDTTYFRDFTVYNGKGTKVLCVDGSAGAVGIGTDAPQKQLEIHGDADTCLRIVSSSNGVASLQLGDADDHIKGAITFKSDDNSLRIRGHNNDDRIIITSGGKAIFSEEIETPQDYPNIRPTLDFNFAATKKLDPRLEYQRTGPASFVNEFGNIVVVGRNVPRFDHDPVTRESKGILIEEQRSNDVANSQNVGGYSGGYMNGGTFTYPDDVTAPDGSTEGVLKIVSDTSTGYHGVQYTISGFGSNQNWAYQVWVKALPGSSINQISLYDNAQSGATNNGSLVMNTTTGVFSYNGNNAESVAYNNGWYQIKIKGNRSTTNAQSAMLLVLYNGSTNQFAGDGSSGFYVWGGQYENDTHHWTSFIPTYGTTATRGRDELTMSGSDLTDVFNNEEGTMFYEASLGDLTNDNQPIVGFRDVSGTTSDYHAIGWRLGGSSDSIRTWFRANGGNEFLSSHSSTGLTANMFYKHIYGYKLNDCADAYSVGTSSGLITQASATGDANPMIASGLVDELRFGGYYAYESQPTTYGLDAGHIKRFSYWTQKLTNSQLTTYIS